MNEPLITFEDLAIGYDDQPVLSGISLAISGGSFTAILGTNGSGKSTFVKTLLGLQPPLSGRMRVSAAGGAPPVFGYVPQAAHLDPLFPLTVFDVALMGAYGRVVPGRRVPHGERSFVKECLHAAAADEFAGKRFGELSGGQKQRVLVSRALVTKPDVLVLDEPTAGVDVAAAHLLSEFISGIHKERGLTTLWVTHDLSLARKRAQYVLWLHEGKVLYGPAAELLSPQNVTRLFESELG